MKKRKNFLIFFIVPYLIFVLFSYSIFTLNTEFLKQQFEEKTSANFLELGRIYSGALLNIVKKSRDNLEEEIKNFFFDIDQIVYYAIRKSKDELLDYKTKYEGFAPVFDFYPQSKIDLRKVITPVGVIFELSLRYPVKAGVEGEQDNVLTLGMEPIYAPLARKGYLRYYIIICLLIAVLIFLSYLRINKYYHDSINKEKGLLYEKKEKEYFQSLSIMSMGISHEVKNPLNTLSLILENILLKNPGSPKVKKLVAEGQEEIDRLIRLSNSFALLLKSDQKNRERWEFFKFSILDIIKRSIKITKRAFSTNIEFSNDTDESPLIFGNSELTLLMLSNLLKNSCESSGPEGVVKVTLRREDHLIIEIRDTGGGLEENIFNLEKPFETKKKGNLGIGLFIIKKVIDFHAWEMKVGNESSGAVFKITLKES